MNLLFDQSIVDSESGNMSEKFSLKWNDFNSNVSKSFGIFRNEEYLHDVTLVSDDQHQVTAHKFVLSASSDYFKNIFKNNKLQNPFLCLDGISSKDLNNILDYIYNGEVQVYQDHLDKFLSIAQRFKLEGLLGEVKEEEDEKDEIEDQSLFYPSERKSEKINSKQPESYAGNKNTSNQLKNQIQLLDTTDLNEIDQKLYENMERNSMGKYSCKICSKTNLDKTNMKYHVETHMEGLSFPCNTCGKEFRLRDSLKKHRNTQHKLLFSM